MSRFVNLFSMFKFLVGLICMQNLARFGVWEGRQNGDRSHVVEMRLALTGCKIKTFGLLKILQLFVMKVLSVKLHFQGHTTSLML